ncbi:DUF6415 family natural product biosynthesis protein [Streptomyces sp. N35]|uniref:DUF6415 family natural product biosynthesis protein n=1 Tax=Streptomyces sp. N35 TaxID=2795730 RepID=UPI0018F2C717|nr:DUF6415 family natural product biosynthesis protein [Streptomyces sp. N35]
MTAAMTPHSDHLDLHEVARICDRALSPPRRRPADGEVKDLTGRLHTALHALALRVEATAADRRGPKVNGALRDLEGLRERGPSDGPFGAWTYMRALARVTRVFVAYLKTQKTQ